MGGKRSVLPKMAVILLSVFLSQIIASAQTTLPSGVMDRLNTRDRDQSAAEMASQAAGPALQSVINPNSYYVGPSDGFSVNIWTDPPRALRLTVTPEGTLIVPTVGEFRVANLTITQMREKLLAEIKKRYKFGEVSVTLITPRSVVVSVQGRVLKPGSYVVPAYSRVEKAIEEANRVVNPTMQETENLNRLKEDMSTRRIFVRHTDGSQSRADLKKFIVTRDDQWNPYLREGDIVVVPRNDASRNVFGVYGHVTVPGRYEYVKDDSVRDALMIAFGLTPMAHADSVEFIKQDSLGQVLSRRIINGGGILAGTEANIAIEPGDRLLVHGFSDLRGDYVVFVAGRVRNPGTYPISRNGSRITDAIRSAGGFQDDASLASAELTRRSVGTQEIETERLESLRGGVPPDDSSYYYLETSLRLRKELVQTDFEALFLRGDSSQNMILQDGDAIVVPSVKRTIYVFGQVNNPGHVPYLAGKDASYYIEKAGGVTDRSREGDVKIVRARTRQWISPKGQIVHEGDYVWVPKDPERPFAYYLNVAAQAAAVISTALSLVLLVNQLNK
jgi:polysaccharide biosynthesis/export protein